MQMPRTVAVPLIVVLLAVVAAAGGVALFLARRAPPMAEAAFDALLDSVDASISQGYLSTAADALRSARGAPRSESDRLRLLKRAFEIGRSSGDYSMLADLAAPAYGGARSERIRAVAAYAYLRSGRIAEARRLFGAHAAGSLEPLRGEAMLRSGSSWAGSDDLTREILALQGSDDPAAFARAGLGADEKQLSLDAAILAMEKGDAAAGAQIARADLVESRFDEPAGLILYDDGALSEASARLGRAFSAHPQSGPIGLVLADISAASGSQGSAQAWLLRSLPLSPSISWTPYADLALFALDQGDLAGAARRVEDGLAFFPASRELKLMKARVLARSGDNPGAQSILAVLAAEHPPDTEASLLLLSLQGPSMSPEALRGRLWKLFQLAPTDPAVFYRLASTLIAARDWDGMRIAVEERQAAGGAPDARSLLLQGFASAMWGDDAAALSAFRRSDLLAKDGKAHFDAALVLLRRGGARDARDELDAAESEIQDRASPAERPFLQSRVESLRGAALMLDGDPAAAASALERARQLDPYNLRASLLLRKLEAGGQ